jgi:hypothetical protein
MFRLASAVVATLSFTAIAAEPSTHHARSNLVALSTNRADTPAEPATQTLALDDYAGVYRTADGATFVVVRDGDHLTIEMPETVALPIRASGPSFVLDAAVVRIEFETGNGAVRMVLVRALAEPIVATRVQLPHGIVTVHDI